MEERQPAQCAASRSVVSSSRCLIVVGDLQTGPRIIRPTEEGMIVVLRTPSALQSSAWLVAGAVESKAMGTRDGQDLSADPVWRECGNRTPDLQTAELKSDRALLAASFAQWEEMRDSKQRNSAR